MVVVLKCEYIFHAYIKTGYKGFIMGRGGGVLVTGQWGGTDNIKDSTKKDDVPLWGGESL